MERFNNILNPVARPEKTVNPVQKIIQEAELIIIEKQNRNKDGLLLASDGSISHYQNELYWKILKTDSFVKWFNGSVAVHEDNKEPLMLFHSTLKREIVGSNLKLNERVNDWNSFGVYFSSNKQATIGFYNTQYKDDIKRFERLLGEDSVEKEDIILDKEKYIIENSNEVKTFNAFVKIQKPLKLNNHEELMEISWAGFNRQDLLKEHDGAVINNDSEFSDQYIVFKEENILVVPSEID
jgi:hypothetical protein